MSVARDERDRILHLLEVGQVNATEAAQLLDALGGDVERSPERTRERVIRMHLSNPHARKQKINVAAVLPVSLLRASLRLGMQLLPQLDNEALEDLLRTIDNHVPGRLLDLQDLDRGERLEIFVE